ncbi:RES family NAD+ phosphorylase [Novosphingobium sediminicola]|uniref:RES domain-containing protein n=1 Tax=Novosphingobium sediminicola TaxID=563162 RepID=A0A7W6G7J2_9SPHN|nr:RES family NAD+ phosphorylase [Novosphingobium sediminicola]MBB3956964.1 hypothetical protein [Novosphingobium sediminicola]
MTAASSGGITPPTVPPPPSPLSCNLHTLTKSTVIHRIHDKRFGAIDFNPGFGNTRFAPFRVGGKFVPTAYAATSLECAIYETLYHDIEPAALFKSVYWTDLAKLVYSTVEVARDIDVAKLFTADLLKWHMVRGQLIDTPKSCYPQTQLWSPAIHGSGPTVGGMVWTSNKYDEDRAMLLFGDRVAIGDLNPLSSVDIISDPTTLQLVTDLAARSGIDIIKP